MNREEYLEMLATEPATPNQRGAIMGEFARLGVADRGERLAACAALLGLGELGSTADLLMGEAGRLVNLLQRLRDRAELLAVVSAAVDDAPQAGERSAAAPAAARATWWEEMVSGVASAIQIVLGGKRPGA